MRVWCSERWIGGELGISGVWVDELDAMTMAAERMSSATAGNSSFASMQIIVSKI